jgi:hypothetical protein
MLGASSNSCCASSTAAEGAASSARLGCTSGDGGAAEGAASSARLACTSGDGGGGAELSLSESELVESSPASCRAGATFGTSPFCLRHSRKQKGKPAMTSTTANVQATARRIALVETIICVAVDSQSPDALRFHSKRKDCRVAKYVIAGLRGEPAVLVVSS